MMSRWTSLVPPPIVRAHHHLGVGDRGALAKSPSRTARERNEARSEPASGSLKS
jgi:hypothetical protein